MNKFNPKKLLNSKWTAVSPVKNDKHFIVTTLKLNENNTVIICKIEAIMSKNISLIDWRDLQDDTKWKMGWK
ncbi:MAG: TIGR02450 family Trp-rich protein [Marinicellaceae bacterium]